MNPLITTPGYTAYEGLVELMAEYLSIPSVESMLDVVLRTRGLSPGRLQYEDLAEVVAETIVGLRLFCDKERVPELMLALADYGDQESDDDAV